jgi:hypothetical protein
LLLPVRVSPQYIDASAENITNESSYDWTIPKNLLLDWYILLIKSESSPNVRSKPSLPFRMYPPKPFVFLDDAPSSLLTSFTMTLIAVLSLAVVIPLL